MQRRIITSVAMAALVGLAASAHATVVTGVDIFNGATPDATFVGSGAFELKTHACTIATEGCPLTGVGVAGGRTAGEIDIDETITGTFDSGVTVDFFQLVLLYEGPEFSDTAEIAQVTATLVGGGTSVGWLQTVFDGAGNGLTAIWTGPGGLVTNLSPARETEGALWRVDNPFGSLQIASLEFTAISNLGPGYTCLPGEGSCTNDSDYSIHKIGYSTAAVPEPGTLSLLAGGLVAVLARARRRRSR